MSKFKSGTLASSRLILIKAVSMYLLLTLACTGLAYLALFAVRVSNDRALEEKFSAVLIGTTLPDTKLVYSEYKIFGVSNGGGCTVRVIYIFATSLSEKTFMLAYDNVPTYERPSWIDPVKFQSDDEIRISLSKEEISIIESILASKKNVAQFLYLGSVDFGMLNNGFDTRCENFD